MATGTALLGGINANVNFILKSYFKKSPILQVFLFWAVGTKNNDSCVLLLMVQHSAHPLRVWFDPLLKPEQTLQATWLYTSSCSRCQSSQAGNARCSDFSEELKIETRWDVDGVHSQGRRVKGEQNGKHVLVVQQQLLRVIPILKLCLDRAYEAHCYSFFKLIQGSIKV